MKENENDTQWDRLLKIKTTGRDDTGSDQYRYPYEPTPYNVLMRLSESGLIGKKNTVVDYGTGKGRVCFFLSYQTRCKSIGIEYSDRIISSAYSNKDSSIVGRLTEFVNECAEKYELPDNVDVCYFFNPFALDIFQKTLMRIKESYYRNPRKIKLVCYYTSDEYLSFLMSDDLVSFVKEIDCSDMFDGNNPRERLHIFEI